MKSRLLFIRKNIVTLLEPRRYASSKSTHCDAHMNELPIPCGPFKPYYDHCQAFYNKVLAFGSLWFAFSFVFMLWTGSLYLNLMPPAQPGPPTEMVSDADDRC
nr:uncharacterized protein LOC128671176 [Plodia interpunctella]